MALGHSARLRATPAFAKEGRERYRFPFAEELKACLAELAHPDRPLCLRAALAYLDICFFHPFEDGNARLARLLLDAVLWREGWALHVAEPIFTVSRSAGASAEWHLASAINLICSRGLR